MSGGGATAKRSKASNWILGVVILLAGLFALFLFTLMFGNVTGTEFAPHNFESRNYHVLRIPLLNLQVWPATRTKEANPLVEHLFGRKILTPGKPEPPEYDLVEELAGARRIRGDAQYLQKYLQLADDQWLDWTKSHPELAKVFWPEVQRVAQRRMYTAIPEMFHIAEQEDSPEALKAALHRHAAAHYLLLGRAEYEQGAVGPAIVLLEEAKSYAPADAEIERWLTEVKSKAEKKPASS